MSKIALHALSFAFGFFTLPIMALLIAAFFAWCGWWFSSHEVINKSDAWFGGFVFIAIAIVVIALVVWLDK